MVSIDSGLVAGGGLMRGLLLSFFDLSLSIKVTPGAQQSVSIIGTFRFEYEYEIEYENDFSILVCRLHIITTQTNLIP